ncbi:pyridoxal phosphate-dependent aminotransferase [Clostridium oryzae]|uniref:Threonine-phosphate decarboxylase n=1 Tax=Clostridium oryzae TaxID=1450648 RepID=A0A1V4IUD8_9CLOT|nr:threonine-phosphate decarboxylase [Clostridium oryzae]OPJ63057.1 threonine-phosphate decarboxylase [Clostridium oryzae]
MNEKTYTQHGGDIYTEGLLKGNKILDFSANINFLGTPKSLESAVKEAMKSITRYPDIEYRRLKKTIADYLHIDNDKLKIIPGNGAAEIIDLAVSLFKSMCIVVPSFSEYERCAHIHGCQVTYSELKDDMTFDYEDILERLKTCEALLIGNPNNPNGFIIDKEKFMEIIDYCDKNDKTIIIDEAFIEFVGDEKTSFIHESSRYECLLLIRAVTKFFALPGIRLGYGITANEGLADKIRERQLPWTVNSFAETTAEHIYRDSEYIRKSINANKDEREYLKRQLVQLPAISKVYDGRANFLLCKLNNITAEQMFNYCLKEHILIRKCDNYRKLDKYFIRLAVKSRSDNNKLINVLRKANL